MELNKVSYELDGIFHDFYVIARTRDEAYSIAVKTLKQRELYDLISALIVSDSYVKPPFAFEGEVFCLEEE